jgi:hypothetical protein
VDVGHHVLAWVLRFDVNELLDFLEADELQRAKINQIKLASGVKIASRPFQFRSSNGVALTAGDFV